MTLALLAVGCAPGTPQLDIAAEEATVLERTHAWVAAEATNNTDSALSYMWEDIVMQPPNMPQLEGHAAVRQLYETVRFMAVDPAPPLAVRVAASGDLAAVWGNFTSHLELLGPGITVSDTAKFVAVWEKRDGVWKIVENSWSSNLAPALP